MEYIQNTKPSRKINTRGCCFLCLQSENNQTEKLDWNEALKSISILHLLRHLQISTTQPLGEKSIFGQGFKEDIQVELCESCGQMMTRFSDLFQKLEKIQLEMDYFLERIHKCITQSVKDPELVQSYSKRMTSDLEALSQLAFVDILRKHVAKESLRKAAVPNLQLILTRTDIQLVKTENSDELCESNDRDVPGNYFLDDISPPPSPTATFDHEEDVKFSTSASTSQENKISPLVKPPEKRKSKKSKYFRKDIASGMYECNGCDKKSKNSITIVNHFKSDHLKIRYKCDICNISEFTRISKVTKHKKICRQNLEKEFAKEKDPNFKFICKICGQRFNKEKSLYDHVLLVHKNVDRYPCDLCDKKFKKAAHLRDHRDAVHLGKRLNCGFCSKDFAYKRDVQLHEKKCANKLSLKEEPHEKLDVVNKKLN